ncbi:MAG: hypothetical protein ACI8YQ_003196 [Polaribacter sp.]|jgi:hypothetical protein
MLERNPVFLCLVALMSFVLASSCNRRAIPKTGEVKTEKQDSNPATIKGDNRFGVPSSEVIKREEKIELPEPIYLLLRLEKTACHGDCPVYELKFYSDGRAIWHGQFYCDRLGYYEAYLPKVWRDQLMARAEGIRFFSLLDHYPAEGPYLSDLPNTIVYLNDGEKEKSITQNYLTPKALIGFEAEVLKVVEGLAWEAVGTE